MVKISSSISTVPSLTVRSSMGNFAEVQTFESTLTVNLNSPLRGGGALTTF